MNNILSSLLTTKATVLEDANFGGIQGRSGRKDGYGQDEKDITSLHDGDGELLLYRRA